MIPVPAQTMSAAATPREERPPRLRLLQGALLVSGAVLIELVVGELYLVPLSLGLAYLAAALAGGRRGGYWPTAVVLVGFGVAVVVTLRLDPGLSVAGMYVLGAGVGALAVTLLGRRGLAVDPVGVAGTVAVIGLVVAVRSQIDALGEVRTYAVLLGLVGLANVIAGAVLVRRGTVAAPDRSNSGRQTT